MIDNKKVLAIVPARSGSKGLKNKNILSLKGKPLVSYPINAANKSLYIDRVMVSTDSNTLANIASKHGAEIPYIRPSALATDEALSSDVIIHLLKLLEDQLKDYEYLVFLEPTSPLTSHEDIDEALKTLVNSKKHTALVSVAKVESTHPDFCLSIKDNQILPYKSQHLNNLTRRQDLEDLYFIDGSIYISKISDFLVKKTFYHEDTFPFKVPYWKSLEIDTYLDLVCVEAIVDNIREIKINNDE